MGSSASAETCLVGALLGLVLPGCPPLFSSHASLLCIPWLPISYWVPCTPAWSLPRGTLFPGRFSRDRCPGLLRPFPRPLIWRPPDRAGTFGDAALVWQTVRGPRPLRFGLRHLLQSPARRPSRGCAAIFSSGRAGCSAQSRNGISQRPQGGAFSNIGRRFFPRFLWGTYMVEDQGCSFGLPRKRHLRAASCKAVAPKLVGRWLPRPRALDDCLFASYGLGGTLRA